jgi:hypothetical protein
MEPIYIFLIGLIGIIIAIGVGLELSSGIEDFVIYILFWMLYIITIATFINIILVGNYYLTMKDKTGPVGAQGPQGDQGDNGNTGLCDPTCRDSICENQLIELITDSLKNKTTDSTLRFNNVYIKSKIKQMCASDEFKQLAPYNGPQNLINYLKDIWKLWFDLLYNAGGRQYFENIAAESEFEWLSDNPFQEIKQYDVFYWGMGKQYRPQIVDKCYNSTNGNTPDISGGSVVRASPTNLYDKLGDDSGSGAVNNVSFWRARQFTYKGAVYYPVGDLAVGPSRYNDEINMKRTIGYINLQHTMSGPNRETIIVSGDVVGPIDYDLIWTNNKFWLWRPIAPLNYISLGDIVTFTSATPPTGNNAPIRCVSLDLTIRIKPNSNILWSSYGSSAPTNGLILGFEPNDGSFVSSGVNTNNSNCYNMFRTIVGYDSTNIPESDVNGGFYYLDSNKYDSNYIIGMDKGIPPMDGDSNKVGKGYIKFPKKDAKYSVLSYLNLKNNPVLKHQMTNFQINAQLVPNAISNAYLINVGNDNIKKCLNFNGNSITVATCDEESTSQIFSIIFTGNAKNECKLQHNDSKNIINYKDGLFTLVAPDYQTNIEYQLFTMQ